MIVGAALLGIIIIHPAPLVALTLDSEPIIADHIACTQFDNIPASYFDSIRTDYRIFYGHTSHGSQVITGLNSLQGLDPLYTKPTFYEYGDDLGHNGDTSWVQPTRDYLDAHPDYNVVMWSWCWGCSDNTEEGINIYLNAMNDLETDYPDVTFIYMTGHLDGTGPDGNLYIRNNQIRAYCLAHSKVLFDFADIESYDPDGNYYPDDTDVCNWCVDWCADPSHNCADDCTCAHSHCFNCWLKGKAFWWMMARIDGWTGNGENHPPYAPTNPSPENNSVDIPIDTDLSWVSGDPDSGDIVTYDVYFGSDMLEKIAENHTDTSFSLEGYDLAFNTSYRWTIVAWDNHGVSTEGGLWQFTTTDENAIPSIEIRNITGGMGLAAHLINTGEVNATHIEWTISVEGGFFFPVNKTTADTIALFERGATQRIALSPPLFGLGPVEITILCDADNMIPLVETRNAFLLIFYLFLFS